MCRIDRALEPLDAPRLRSDDRAFTAPLLPLDWRRTHNPMVLDADVGIVKQIEVSVLEFRRSDREYCGHLRLQAGGCVLSINCSRQPGPVSCRSQKSTRTR